MTIRTIVTAASATILLSTSPLSSFAADGIAPEAAQSERAAQLVTPQAAQVAKNEQRPRIGLALGGGGTRGIAHIAVLKTLAEAGIPIDCISGTSMGAIVGGLYAAGLTPAEIEKMFRNKSMIRSYDTVPIPMRVGLIPLFFPAHMAGYHPYDGLYRGNRFAHYIDNAVGPKHCNIESTKIPFCAVASNLLDGLPATISTGSLGRALQASSAIPELRRPLYWQGKLLVDGGIVANLPVEQCRAMGADIVIAVNVDEDLGHLDPKQFHKIFSVPYRCLNMHLSRIDLPQQQLADLVIHPDVNGIALLSRSLKDMDIALKEGEKATTEALPKIQDYINKKLAGKNQTLSEEES